MMMASDRSFSDEGYFYFDPNDPIYQDHFPGRPVVPGSLIIHAFMERIARSVPGKRAHAPHRFRFKRFVQPGRYSYRIVSKSDGRMACFLYDNGNTVVTGAL